MRMRQAARHDALHAGRTRTSRLLGHARRVAVGVRLRDVRRPQASRQRRSRAQELGNARGRRTHRSTKSVQGADARSTGRRAGGVQADARSARDRARLREASGGRCQRWLAVMSKPESKIEWTRWVWDFLRGCSRVSPGCENCYAERYAHRFSGPGLSFEGLTRLSKKGEPRWTGRVRWLGHAHVRKLRAFDRQAERERVRSRVFVNSKSDTFHANAQFDLLDIAYEEMAACTHLDHLVLTKRPERMLEYEN